MLCVLGWMNYEIQVQESDTTMLNQGTNAGYIKIIFFVKTFVMENPFELIMEKLNSIEALLKSMPKNENGTVKLTEITDVMNADEAAKYTSLSKSAIYKMTAQREIPHFKRGKKLVFKKAELDDWLTQHRITTKDEIDKMATEYIIRNPLKRKRY